MNQLKTKHKQRNIEIMNQSKPKQMKKQIKSSMLIAVLLLSLLITALSSGGQNVLAAESEPQTSRSAGEASESTTESGNNPTGNTETQPSETASITDPTTGTEPTTQPDTTPSTSPSTPPSEQTEPGTKPTDNPTQPASPDQPNPQPTGIPYLLVGEDAIIKGKCGEKIKLKLPLVNLGNAPAINLTASPILASRDEEFPFEIERSEYLRSLKGKLEPVTSLAEIEKATKKIDFGEFRVRENLTSGYYKVSFKINYRYPGSNKFEEIERYFFIKVENPTNPNPNNPEEPPVDPDNSFDPGAMDGGYYGGEFGGSEEPNKSTPRLLINNFSTNPEKLLGGKEFTLSLTLKNTSKDFSLRNIKLTLSSQGEESVVFLPVDGASTIYIENIDKEAEQTIDVKLKSNPTVEQKFHPLDIKFEYEDNKGNPYTSDEMISIMIYQELRCDIGKIEIMPNPVYTGTEANVMFSIHNKGKATLYNVSVVIPEGSVLEANENFIGNIESGNSKDVDFMIKAISPSMEEEIPFQITFEDAEGNVSTLDQSMPLMVEEYVEPEPYPDPFIDDPAMMGEVEENPGLPWYVYLIIGVVAVVGVGVLIGVLRKRKLKKEQAEIDEMV